MVIGEKCKVTLLPDYAYGVAGSPPKIPPNATLVFEIELLSFESEKDLNKDGGVLKAVVSDGEGYKQPSYETLCRFRIKVTGESGAILADTFNGELVTATIGETRLMKGIESALKSMKKGERATFKIRKDYNEAQDEFFAKATAPELAKIPPNTGLEADIELVELTPPQETWELNGFAEKLDFALKRKADGNNFFSKNDLTLAAKKYKKALKVFEYDGGVADDEKAKAKTEVKLPCHLNLAQCYLKKEKYKKAIEQCNKALEIDAKNIKGLWRRGTAYMESSEFVKSKQDFTRALEIDPENKPVKASLVRLKKLETDQDRKDKARFKNLFEKLRDEENSESAPASTS
jgi:FK506-binding protein 4/5